MFPDAYQVTIKSSRFDKLLQAFEESPDCVLLIGVARRAMASLQVSSISFHFELRECFFSLKHFGHFC